MDGLLLDKYLQFTYLKLHFTLRFERETVLPIQKASAIRGGMGEMLLRMNCIRDRVCPKCPYEEECIVRRIMYSKMRLQPDFMSAGDSVGYVLCCEDYRERIAAGDTVEFSMTLFGRMIVYFGQILQAIQYLGYQGLGKEKACFQVIKVTNSRRQDILDGNNVYMEKVQEQKLADYAAFRKSKDGMRDRIKLQFHTPVAIKSQGVFLNEFAVEPFLKSISRRIYMLNCYEGNDMGKIAISEELPQITRQKTRTIKVRRYSSTHDNGIELEGIVGECDMEQIKEQDLELLYAGEILHVGKNTSFGFGRFTVRDEVNGATRA